MLCNTQKTNSLLFTRVIAVINNHLFVIPTFLSQTLIQLVMLLRRQKVFFVLKTLPKIKPLSCSDTRNSFYKY